MLIGTYGIILCGFDTAKICWTNLVVVSGIVFLSLVQMLETIFQNL